MMAPTRTLILERRGVKPFGYFMLLWLIGWAGQIGVVMYGMASDQRWDGELVMFLLLSSIIDVFVLRSVLWYFRGKEFVSFEAQHFTIERKGSFLFGKLKLRVSDVEGFSLRKRQKLWLRKLLMGQDQLVVSYLGRRSRFGRWCSSKEAGGHLVQLNDWLAEHKRSPLQ